MSRAHAKAVVLMALACAAATAAPPAAPARFTWDLPQGFPEPKVPPDNPMTVEKVDLGRHLFYDTRLSIDGTYACATCHRQVNAFTEGRRQAVGVSGDVHPRNSMGLTNVAYSPVLTWANPTERRLETQALVPMFGEQPVELGLSGREALLFERLRADPRYVSRFRAAFPDDTDPFTLANLTRAIASFERTLISGRSPYDRFRAGNTGAMSASAQRGLSLFFSERTECFHCHGGFNFTQTVDYSASAFSKSSFTTPVSTTSTAAADIPRRTPASTP